MKRTISAIALGLGLSLLAMTSLDAQDRPYSYGQGMGWDADQSVPIGRLRDRLGLSAEETERMRTAIENRQETVRPLADQLRRSMDRLDRQVRDKASDSDVRATLDRLDETYRSIQDADERFFSDTASFLTPIQQAQLRLELRTPTRGSQEGSGYGTERSTSDKPHQRPIDRPDRETQMPGSVPGTQPPQGTGRP